MQTATSLNQEVVQDKWGYYRRIRDDVQREVLKNYLCINYRVNDIPITEVQTIHTIFLPCHDASKQHPQNYYMSHGFGGTSLMNFLVFQPLLMKGNVILCQIRGMGFSQKLQTYEAKSPIEIQQFYLQGIEVILTFYNHNNATMIGHSLSSYLILTFLVRKEEITKKHVKQILVTSPAGITVKQQDYKQKISSCSDFMDLIVSNLGWLFNLTYKSPLRTICSCFKRPILMGKIKSQRQNQQLNEIQRILMYQIINSLIFFPDGSECLFFEYFQPRILPKIGLQPLFVRTPSVNVTLVYGGQLDWVDKTGGIKIAERFPDKIRIIDLPNCGHNIPFYIKQCKQLYQFAFK